MPALAAACFWLPALDKPGYDAGRAAVGDARGTAPVLLGPMQSGDVWLSPLGDFDCPRVQCLRSG